MVLHTHSDVSYLTVPHARSHVGSVPLGNHFTMKAPNQSSLNYPVHCEEVILLNVISSEEEAAIGPIYCNAKWVIPLQVTLWYMGQPQPDTPICTDHYTSSSFTNSQIKRLQSVSTGYRIAPETQDPHLLST